MAKKKFVSYIDRMCRQYGEEEFGKDVMDTITDEQVEAARIEAFIMLSEYVAQYGAHEGNDTFKQFFCLHVKYNYLTEEVTL